MIIHQDRGRLRTTLQTDHAVLAGEFAAAWGGRLFHPPEPVAAVRLAADLHDQGWAEWEREPRIMPGTGRPYDFMSLPPEEHTELYARGIEQVAARHPYSGLLVSLHGSGLYRKRYGYMPHLKFKEHGPAHQEVIDRFLAQQDLLQRTLIEDLNPSPAALWTHYRWLQAWDLLSLFLCLYDPEEGREMSLGSPPAYPGGPEVPLTVRGAGPGRFTVAPWPFAHGLLELVVPVRYLPDRAYASDADFQTAFEAVPTVALNLALMPEEPAEDPGPDSP